MFKIGDFSKLTKISIRTLHHYDNLEKAIQEMGCWISDNGYEFSGPMFNIYYTNPATEPDPNKYVTEVCFSVTKVK